MAREPKQLSAAQKALALYQKSNHAIEKGKPLSGTIILCDSSGSMRKSDDASKTRFEWLCTALTQIQQSLTDATYYHFNDLDGTNEFQPQHAKQIFPHGGTPLDTALLKLAKLSPKQLLLVSDGKPDDERDALNAAASFPGRIDVIYVGDEKDRESLHFMRMLATKGGGTATVQTLSQKQLPTLTQQIKKLLPAK